MQRGYERHVLHKYITRCTNMCAQYHLQYKECLSSGTYAKFPPYHILVLGGKHIYKLAERHPSPVPLPSTVPSPN